ncbi:MAG: alpha/beta fold hydrolase [Candidatus Odinarchaeota archaeon]|nr:alpha/beta fold hydrolase [Candidatus Odinarchaeota archaeon]
MSFTADTWDNLGTLDVLCDASFGVFALDMPGFGKLSRRRLNRHAAADVLKQILDKLQINKAVLIGPSMGGGIVLSFSIKYTSYVTGLVLIAPARLNDDVILDNLKLNMPVLLF